MGAALAWERDAAGWPNHEASRFVQAGGLRWHVQVYGEGPPALLLHGSAASVHSWRDFGPRLAEHYTVVALDLPGHGFSAAPSRRLQTLSGAGEGIAELLDALGVAPRVAIGHSVGAALLARMALDGRIQPDVLISINGAFLPFSGIAGHLFPTTARLLTYNPLVPFWLAFRARNRVFLADVLARTGSRIDEAGIDLYQRLATHPGHVAAALGMMARTHDGLYALMEDLPQLTVPLVLFAASGDRTVPPAQAERVRLRLPSARLEILQGLGHLAHEEAPDRVTEQVLAAIRATAPKGRGGADIR
ncbi:alpha/beta fold hydrolase BchO [Halorhodospira halophila]|uniref:Alpha/beta hydrolase fold protein n=1 Tax=Halorhodospira halophila (strain DSM 244 / SL1) TaxID=349124 RepID=A1WXH2_HALHL|nr:alpha/beta fold hydrolase BchO [Halorhodospira halophila]ABM62384.1 alpha/beta hydrolase fold protein [Halorhodospira halophila SL1]MBK1729514.1 alpha/beta hydrolase [Halorhodospira halophila]